MTKQEHHKVMDLYSKPASYKFTEEELELIKKSEPKSNYEVRYGLYNKHSARGEYIAFIIDSEVLSSRRSLVENLWEIIAKREISEEEYNDEIANFGLRTRRFMVWYYKDIETLVNDDAKYGIVTPEEFVKICKKKGYTKSNAQLKMKL